MQLIVDKLYEKNSSYPTFYRKLSICAFEGQSLELLSFGNNSERRKTFNIEEEKIKPNGLF